MTRTVILLTEDALQPSDVDQILDYYPAGSTFQVLVPADTDRNVLVDVINHLGVGELREAWEEITEDEPSPREARQEASMALELSLGALTGRGLLADGVVVQDDPLPALTQAVNNHRADEVLVVTEPKMLDDTFRRDWASRAREALGVPVLHLYTGSSIVG